jgi:hypothetical protein
MVFPIPAAAERAAAMLAAFLAMTATVAGVAAKPVNGPEFVTALPSGPAPPDTLADADRGNGNLR